MVPDFPAGFGSHPLRSITPGVASSQGSTNGKSEAAENGAAPPAAAQLGAQTGHVIPRIVAAIMTLSAWTMSGV